jgi:hypothetical protein
MREGTASEDGKEERSNKEDTGFVSRPMCSNSFLLVQIRSVLCDDVELHIYEMTLTTLMLMKPASTYISR